MALYVYPSFFDLLSIDPYSLQFIALTRFCAADVKIVTIQRTYGSPAGSIPGFVDENDKIAITDFEQFVDYMRNAHREIVLDYELTPEQRSLSVAYGALVSEKLVPALEYLFWLDDYNYDALTRPAYSKVLCFPHYLVILHAKRNEVRKRFEARNKQPKELMKDAVNALNLLSAKLGEQKYFNGIKPSSFDAFLFGHLAPLLKLPLANEHLKHHLESQPNLCIYLENIASIYMPLSEEQLRESVRNRADFLPNVDRARRAMDSQRNNERIKKADKEKSELDSKQNLIIFGLATFGLSLAFALHVGIIQVPKYEIRQVTKKKFK